MAGVSWSVVARVGTQITSFISVATLARLLQPNDYGLVGMAQVVIGVMALFREIGIGTAVIQRREAPQILLSTLFWTTLGLGLLIALAGIAGAPLVAAFYQQPAVGDIFRVLLVSFTLTSAGTVPLALLNRHMRFRALALIEIAGAVAGLLVAIFAARAGAGPWSLVFASLTTAAVLSAGSLWAAGWMPSLAFSLEELRSILAFGLNLSAFNFVNYFARNADSVIIGRYLGASTLGFYQFAYNLMLYPIQSVSWLLGRVLLPAFARMQDDDARLRQAYLRSCGVIASITFPMMLGLMPVADLFVSVVLGPKWLPAVPALVILAPVGMVQSLLTTTGQIYVIKQRTDLLFRMGLVNSVVIVASFFLGLPWGMRGVASAYAAATGLILLPTLWVPFGLVGLRLGAFWKTIWKQLAAALLMSAAVAALRTFLGESGELVALAACILAGGAIYLALIFLLRPPAVADLRLVSAIGPRRAPGNR